ncbi:MAG: ATP-binding protein [Acidimicrobiales bacterium]
MRRSYPASTGALALVRSDFDAWLADSGVSDDERELAVLALAELAANAVEASAEADFDVTYVRLSEDLVELVVMNRSDGADDLVLPAGPLADVFAPRGRGLAIVQQIAESLRLDVTERLATVTVQLRATRSGTTGG